MKSEIEDTLVIGFKRLLDQAESMYGVDVREKMSIINKVIDSLSQPRAINAIANLNGGVMPYKVKEAIDETGVIWLVDESGATICNFFDRVNERARPCDKARSNADLICETLNQRETK